MKISSVVFLALIAVLFGAAHAHAGNLYNKTFIKHQAMRGECTSEQSDDCVNVIGNQAYSYQKRGYERAGKRDERDSIGVDREGKLTGANISKDMRQNSVKGVHQYVEVDKKVNAGGEGMEVGTIKADTGAGRKLNQVQNIVEVKKKVGDVGNVSIGAVEARNGSSVGNIDNKVTTKGIDAGGGVNVGGVRVGNGATVEQINSDTTVDGDINADGPINIGGVRVTNGTIGGVHTTTVVKGNIKATGN